MPALAHHMKTIGVDVAIPSTKWFICLYTDVLPTEVSTFNYNKFLSNCYGYVTLNKVSRLNRNITRVFLSAVLITYSHECL